MKTSRFLEYIILALALIFITGPACSATSQIEDQVKSIAQEARGAIQSRLDSLDRDTAAAASQLTKTGLSGSEARKILNTLYSKYTFTVDVCTADAAGKMITVVPAAYSRFEGTDTGKQDPTVTFNQVKKAMLSQMFRAVEGIDAVVLAYPVSSAKGDLIGSISVLFKPETLFAPVAEKLVRGNKIEILGMQVDGLNIYASETLEIGKNLFKDPMYQPYKELLAVGSKVAAAESGSGSYTFINQGSSQPVKKIAYWVTAGVHGTAWRIVAIKEAAD